MCPLRHIEMLIGVAEHRGRSNVPAPLITSPEVPTPRPKPLRAAGDPEPELFRCFGCPGAGAGRRDDTKLWSGHRVLGPGLAIGVMRFVV